VANEWSVKPAVNEVELLREWKCPVTGLVIPKDPEANLAWRAKVLEMAAEDTDLQQDLYTACSQSLLFFVNFAVFTLRVFQTDEEGKSKQAGDRAHIPFVTWPIQDKHLLRIEDAIDNGEDLLTDKSRDMGATWDHIAVYAHRFLFRDAESHLMISRKEDAVDILDGIPKNYPHGSVADPGTLFGKLDYIMSRLPEWMLPPMNRKKMHLVNTLNQCRVDGESANATAGSSDRRTSIFMDEMAKMKEGESIKRSTKDVTATRLVCSTPNGPGTAYSKWRLSGTIPVFILMWWEHPEKSRGLYVQEDELGRWRIRSPWYDLQCGIRSPKEVAIEIDADHVGSGDTFFEATIIEEHRLLYARETYRTLYVNWKKTVPDSEIARALEKRDLTLIQRGGSGSMRLWASLVQGRLDQTKSYTVSVDISKGQGASNSVIAVACNETREKIAEFADATIPPYELARMATAICLWVGGSNRLPLLIWENNGDPGFDFGRQVSETYQYPRMYYDRAVGTIAQKRGKRYGWRSNPEKKAGALGMLRRAYAHGGFVNHSSEALTEALMYVHYDTGGIGPSEMVEESESARKCHGDRVIADMLCIVGFGDTPKSQKRGKPGNPRSIGFRLQQWKRRRTEAKKRNKFDFRKAG